jgi:hypothetical protein
MGVHLLWSASHPVPSAFATLTQPPWPSQVLPVKQSVTGHVYGMPAQLPFASRTSPFVQGLWSSHAAPAFGTTVHVAVPLQLRSAKLSLTQEIAVPAHTPLASHASAYVQSVPSLQAKPTGLAGLEQLPVVVSQTPTP